MKNTWNVVRAGFRQWGALGYFYFFPIEIGEGGRKKVFTSADAVSTENIGKEQKNFVVVRDKAPHFYETPLSPSPIGFSLLSLYVNQALNVVELQM